MGLLARLRHWMQNLENRIVDMMEREELNETIKAIEKLRRKRDE